MEVTHSSPCPHKRRHKTLKDRTGKVRLKISSKNMYDWYEETIETFTLFLMPVIMKYFRKI